MTHLCASLAAATVLLGATCFLAVRWRRRWLALVCTCMLCCAVGVLGAGCEERRGPEGYLGLYYVPPEKLESAVAQVRGGLWAACCASTLFCAAAYRSRGRQERRSELDPVCRHCGYSLRGLREPRCPECGEPFDSRILRRRPLFRRRGRPMGIGDETNP